MWLFAQGASPAVAAHVQKQQAGSSVHVPDYQPVAVAVEEEAVAAGPGRETTGAKLGQKLNCKAAWFIGFSGLCFCSCQSLLPI